ncbi:hypothetical protein, partial [uncultured Aeromicrobium sp.]|uniref:hypothetical protein n=1 Tax=uncultured Aeromicrobium sp. TaxID=337820 RepID=UPI0025963170
LDQGDGARDPRATSVEDVGGELLDVNHQMLLSASSAPRRSWRSPGPTSIALEASQSTDDTGGVIHVNEPQVWTAIGILGTSLFGMLTLMSTMFVRIIRTEIGSVRTEIGSVRTEIGSVRTEIGSLRTEMQAEFASVRTEIRYLDRDVRVLTKRVFGDGAA